MSEWWAEPLRRTETSFPEGVDFGADRAAAERWIAQRLVVGHYRLVEREPARRKSCCGQLIAKGKIVQSFPPGEPQPFTREERDAILRIFRR